jgi:hypothetical protein
MELDEPHTDESDFDKNGAERQASSKSFGGDQSRRERVTDIEGAADGLAILSLKRSRDPETNGTVNSPSVNHKRPKMYEFGPLVSYIRSTLKSSGEPPLVSDIEGMLSNPEGLAICRLFGFNDPIEYADAAAEDGVIFPVDESGMLVMTEATWMEDPDWDQFDWNVRRPS